MTGRLTAAQREVLRIHDRVGELNELYVADESHPPIRNVRRVVNVMAEHGLLTFGEWTGPCQDGGAGYELHLTDAGREAAKQLA